MKKNKVLVIILIAVIFILIVLPIDINEIFIIKTNSALWSSSDFLSYYGSLLSFIGATVLGVVALKQSMFANALSERMLNLEESKDIPIIDMYTCTTPVESMPYKALQNAYSLSINESYIFFNDDNSVNEKSDMVSLFEIKNISATDIISLKIINVSQKTVFANQKEIDTPIKVFSIGAAISVLSGKESMILTVIGTEVRGPENMDINEIIEENYTTPTIELEITFRMKNYKGIEFEETIKISYIESTNIGDVIYPIILNKDITGIKKVVSKS